MWRLRDLWLWARWWLTGRANGGQRAPLVLRIASVVFWIRRRWRARREDSSANSGPNTPE